MAHDATFMYGITDLVGYQVGGEKKKSPYPKFTIPGTKIHRKKRLWRIAKKQCKAGSNCSIRQRSLKRRSDRIKRRG